MEAASLTSLVFNKLQQRTEETVKHYVPTQTQNKSAWCLTSVQSFQQGKGEEIHAYSMVLYHFASIGVRTMDACT